ncbi:Uncharacterised protein [Mycobacterium tuberculosis]|uniref:Uncharacterized protein n=1 Tax=Mycobacterium tuberculosis TaxID=1773 RepID=A0A916LBB3_MYCTX|nr:Uncharacterised protein [Mycobacterium tuberculosis]
MKEHHEPDEEPPPWVTVGDEHQNPGHQEFRRGATPVGHEFR